MSDFAAITYTEPPTKAQLERRIKLQMTLRGADAVLARDYGLGNLTKFWPDNDFYLLPNGMTVSALRGRIKRERLQQ